MLSLNYRIWPCPCLAVVSPSRLGQHQLVMAVRRACREPPRAVQIAGMPALALARALKVLSAEAGMLFPTAGEMEAVQQRPPRR